MAKLLNKIKVCAVLSLGIEKSWRIATLFESHPVLAQNLVDALMSLKYTIRCKQCESL